MRTVKASADVGESEIAEQPLSHAVAFQSGQRRVLRRQFGTVEKRESSDPQLSFLTADLVELHVKLPRKNHGGVLLSTVRGDVIGTETKRSLLRSRAGRAQRHS